MKKTIFAVALFALSLNVAHAIPITVSFKVSGFISLGGPTAVPTDPVSGTLVYDAASVTGSINSLNSVSLVIAGHTYTLGELGFQNGASSMIGGAVNGVNSGSAGTDDFVISWDRTTLQPGLFAYTTASVNDTFWQTTSFDRFSVTQNSAPEPASLALLALGIAGLGFSRRKRG